VNYLVDTSALVRILRRQVDPQWYDAVRAGRIALCEPVLTETLTIADAKSYEKIEAELRDAYPWVPVVEDVWSVVAAVRRELAQHSQHHGLSVADHLVVATAIRLKLLVLHADADFETVSRVVPQLQQERITGQL
jgi:predicted nucleic acid-binding protein